MHPSEPWFNFTRTTHVSIADCMALAQIAWTNDESREVFVSKQWQPQNPFMGARPRPHKYGLLSSEGTIPEEVATAIAFNRDVRPATLHEALMLSWHRENIPWWGDDFVVTGTTARDGVKTLCPTVSTREGRVYLGIHELYARDLPRWMLLSVRF